MVKSVRINTSLIRSTVGRRILALFVCCALLPIGALAIVSYTQVNGQLSEQSQRRLQQAAKAMGMSIVERLTFLETEMKMLAVSYQVTSNHALMVSRKPFDLLPGRRFKAIALFDGSGQVIPLYGKVDHVASFGEHELQKIFDGQTVITTLSPASHSPRILMMRSLRPKPLEGAFLMGEIDSAYLFGMSNESFLPEMTELCVADHNGTILGSSHEDLPPLSIIPSNNKMGGIYTRTFEWERSGTEYVSGWWRIFLKAQFNASPWTVVLSQSKADVLAPTAYFKKIFPLVVILSLWVVLLLSLVQIRRNLVPLEKLKEGTRQIAMGDFKTRVHITSGDEFQELAESFNTMSRQLGRQFKALTAGAEIDRAILSALRTEDVVETVLTGMRDVFSCKIVSVILIDPQHLNSARTYVRNETPSTKEVRTVGLSAQDVGQLYEHRNYLVIGRDDDHPHYLEPLSDGELMSFMVLPIFLDNNLAGVLALGYHDGLVTDESGSTLAEDAIANDLNDARQAADQVAVALANARLMEKLEQLNWGTLTALARTVDAKSPWTAGHSERVAEVALKIGMVKGLTTHEQHNVRRAGLLHDIGKLAVDTAILDKSGELNDEEYRLIKQHSAIGARILEPIAAYAEIIPIVLQHHEQYDGKGYPSGLSGEEICLGARIMAVADVFDALTSERPYRSGWKEDRAITAIRDQAGSQFDPEIVTAFLEVVRTDHLAQIDQAAAVVGLRERSDTEEQGT